MIPKLMNLYWGRNRPLSFARWMTVASFAARNPDWSIVVYVPTRPAHEMTWQTPEHKATVDSAIDWFPRVAEYATTIELPTRYGRESLPEVMRSDLLRWGLLAKGGWWSDFDVLYVRPMAALPLGDADVVVCQQVSPLGERYNSVGFLGSAPEDGWRFFSGVAEVAEACLDRRKYQSAGRGAMDEFFPWPAPDYGCRVANLPARYIYPVPAWQVRALYGNKRAHDMSDAVGVHWYAGHAASSAFEARAIGPEALKNIPGPLAAHMLRAWRVLTVREAVA